MSSLATTTLLVDFPTPSSRTTATCFLLKYIDRDCCHHSRTTTLSTLLVVPTSTTEARSNSPSVTVSPTPSSVIAIFRLIVMRFILVNLWLCLWTSRTWVLVYPLLPWVMLTRWWWWSYSALRHFSKRHLHRSYSSIDGMCWFLEGDGCRALSVLISKIRRPTPSSTLWTVC